MATSTYVHSHHSSQTLNQRVLGSSPSASTILSSNLAKAAPRLLIMKWSPGKHDRRFSLVRRFGVASLTGGY